MMLSRPSDRGHTPFGDIFCSQSPYLEYWGHHRHVISTEKGHISARQSTKIGPGPVPIETDEGWLLIYHGVINTCNGFVYRMGASLLDLNEPWKVIARSKAYVLGPYELYECVGDVPNVVFPSWQSTKIGPGPVPIETDEGWLLIYHGVINTCNGFVYRMGAALLDLNETCKEIARSKAYVLGPYELYECVGDVPNLVFPCATLKDADTGRIAIYYGCADTVTGLAFTTVDDMLKYIKENAF